MSETFTVSCTLPYALRNEGAAAVGEAELKRRAAGRIEALERAWGAMLDLYDEKWGGEGETDASLCEAFEKTLMQHIGVEVSRQRRVNPDETVGFAKLDV